MLYLYFSGIINLYIFFKVYFITRIKILYIKRGNNKCVLFFPLSQNLYYKYHFHFLELLIGIFYQSKE